jgi:hypothetical protein
MAKVIKTRKLFKWLNIYMLHFNVTPPLNKGEKRERRKIEQPVTCGEFSV